MKRFTTPPTTLFLPNGPLLKIYSSNNDSRPVLAQPLCGLPHHSSPHQAFQLKLPLLPDSPSERVLAAKTACHSRCLFRCSSPRSQLQLHHSSCLHQTGRLRIGRAAEEVTPGVDQDKSGDPPSAPAPELALCLSAVVASVSRPIRIHTQQARLSASVETTYFDKYQSGVATTNSTGAQAGPLHQARGACSPYNQPMR